MWLIKATVYLAAIAAGLWALVFIGGIVLQGAGFVLALFG